MPPQASNDRAGRACRHLAAEIARRLVQADDLTPELARAAQALDMVEAEDHPNDLAHPGGPPMGDTPISEIRG